MDCNLTKEELNRIIAKIHSAEFPPGLDHEKWHIHNGFVNCYAYALQMNIPYSRGDGFYMPGFASGKIPLVYNEKNLIKVFLKDCNVFAIAAIEDFDINEPLPLNTYRIAIYLGQKAIFNGQREFHFIRQNINGKWSHKRGWDNNPTYGIEPTKQKGDLILQKVYRVSKKRGIII